MILLDKIEGESPFITKVVKKRLQDGDTFADALSETLEDSLYPYALGETHNVGIYNDFCKILLAHNDLFVRRIVVSIVLVTLCLLGLYFDQYQLLLFASLSLLMLAFVYKPILRLHSLRKLL
ncbi:hypothetical protein [Photobacterium galatheae]|nr:hypothetical protein [Photobacterium galatheae]MCM0149036.1 hypothetical protein [Photobacterium galatheae]